MSFPFIYVICFNHSVYIYLSLYRINVLFEDEFSLFYHNDSKSIQYVLFLPTEKNQYRYFDNSTILAIILKQLSTPPNDVNN